MADYNSKWTGVDIDNAVEKSAHIGYFNELFNSTSGTTSFDLDNVSDNPATNSKAGLYYVTYEAAMDVQTRSTSVIFIETNDTDTKGSGHTGFDSSSNTIWTGKTSYDGSTHEITVPINAIDVNDPSSSPAMTNGAIYRVYRYEPAPTS